MVPLASNRELELDRTQGVFQSTIDRLSGILELNPSVEVQDLLSGLLDDLPQDPPPDQSPDTGSDPDPRNEPPVAASTSVETMLWPSPRTGHTPKLIKKIMEFHPQHLTPNKFSTQDIILSERKWTLNRSDYVSDVACSRPCTSVGKF